MALSIPQMARMSQLLDEALALDEEGRRVWLDRVAQEHSDLAGALREALLPGAAQAAQLKVLRSLPKLDAAGGSSTPTASMAASALPRANREMRARSIATPLKVPS